MLREKIDDSVWQPAMASTNARACESFFEGAEREKGRERGRQLESAGVIDAVSPFAEPKERAQQFWRGQVLSPQIPQEKKGGGSSVPLKVRYIRQNVRGSLDFPYNSVKGGESKHGRS